MKTAITGRRMRGLPTVAKAKEILRHGTVRGKALTAKARGFMGLIAGGGTPTRRRRRRGKTA